MRKHDQTLRHYRERVEQDQREAGLLTAGASLAEYGQQGQPQQQAPPAQAQPAASPPMDVGMDMMGFGHYDNYGESPAAYQATSQTPYNSYAPAPTTPGRTQPRGAKSGSVSTPAAHAKEVETPGMKMPVPQTTDHPLRVYDRVSQWNRRKQQKLDEERRKYEEREVEGCPFAPTTRSAAATKPVVQKQASIYGGNGRAWGYDEFVERQREARRRTNEKTETAKCSGKNWKNKPTVPVEFQLGRRDKSIKALQKPLSPPTFVPSVSEHHHLAKEVTTLSTDSPLALLGGQGIVQRGLFSERISTAIIDNTMLHPQEEEGFEGYVASVPASKNRCVCLFFKTSLFLPKRCA